MKLEAFVKKPVWAMALALFILIFGLIGYFKMPVRMFPIVPASYVTITTTYPGASPKTMEGFVSTPIEETLSGLDGVDYISAQNTRGRSVVTLKFTLQKHVLDKALPQITNRVQSIMWELPKAINSPIITKVNPNSGPEQAIMYYTFTSNTISQNQLTDYINRVVTTQVEAIPGVASTLIHGKAEYAMRIWLNPQKMVAFNISTAEVVAALKAQNLQATAGQLKGQYLKFNVSAKTDMMTAKQFNRLVIRGGAQPVRIQDIGYAALGATKYDVISTTRGIPSQVFAIVIQESANTITVAKKIQHLFKKLRVNFPPGVHVKPLINMAVFNKNAIQEVKITLLYSCLFVFLVTLLFLGSLRAIVIPLVTIPLSLIGGAGLMWAFGFSDNTLTLLAWVLAIGLVVDDAIVVMENVHRHLEKGMTRVQATIASIQETKSVIFIMTVAVAIVFLPIGFAPGISGALFGEFAYTVSLVVIISGILALTLTPVMCSKMLPNLKTESRFAHRADQVFERLRHHYQKVLSAVLTMRWLVGIVFVLLVIFGAILIQRIPAELIPNENTGIIFSFGMGPPGVNVNYLNKYSKAFNKIYQDIPQLESYGILNGWPNGINRAVAYAVIKDADIKQENQILAEIREKLSRVSGLYAGAMKKPILPGEEVSSPIDFVLKTSGNYTDLSQAIEKVKQAAATYPGIIAPTVNMKMQQVEVDLHIDRNKAAALGISSAQIANALSVYLGQPIVQRFDYGERSFEVIPQLQRQYRMNPLDLNFIYVKTLSGQLVPLNNVVSITTTTQPNMLNQFGQMHSATLTAQIAPGFTLGQDLHFLTQYVDHHLPMTYRYDFTGQSRQYIESQGVLLSAFLFAIVLIYLLLTAFFNSFIEPLIVIVSVPLAMVGALYTMYLAGVTLNIYTEIGLIMLIGLISKHGIMIVHFANQHLREDNMSAIQAVCHAATTRLRPILMTTSAMVAGAIPLIFAGGAGHLARNDIGWTIIGGLLLGTILTLFIVPVAYSLLVRTPHTDTR